MSVVAKSKTFISEVKGPSVNGSSSVVGWIKGQTDLWNHIAEEVTLDFHPDCRPVLEDSKSSEAFRLAQDLHGRERIIASPITTFYSRSTDVKKLYTLSNNQIQSVRFERDKYQMLGNFTNHLEIQMIYQDENPDKINKWNFFISPDVNLNSKVVYIPEFHMWISADKDYLLNLKCRKIKTKEVNPHSIADLVIQSPILIDRRLHYIFNDMPGSTSVIHDPSLPEVMVSLRMNGTEEFENFTINVKEFDELLKPNCETSISHTFRFFGILTLFIDFDEKRLTKYYESVKSKTKDSSIERDAEYEELRNQFEEYKRKTYSVDALKIDYDNKLKAKETLIAELRGKLINEENDHRKREADFLHRIEQLENKDKLEQEKFKTKREEVRYVIAKSDAKTGQISDSLKVVGAVIGFGALILTMMHKNSKTLNIIKASSLIEWSIPMFGFGAASTAISPALLGVGVATTVGIVAFNTSKTIKEVGIKIYETVTETGVKVYNSIRSVTSKVADFLTGWW